MDSRARELIDTLGLAPHPEGGYYREVFRSPALVRPDDGRSPRSALTVIYFLLPQGSRSRWHRVLSDEAWVHLEGAPLDLWQWDAASGAARCTVLGHLDAATGTQAQHVVPAGLWQAARPQAQARAGYSLASCLVGPGFDFADFSFMPPASEEAHRIRSDWPMLADFV